MNKWWNNIKESNIKIEGRASQPIPKTSKQKYQHPNNKKKNDTQQGIHVTTPVQSVWWAPTTIQSRVSRNQSINSIVLDQVSGESCIVVARGKKSVSFFQSLVPSPFPPRSTLSLLRFWKGV
eukprot:c9631_g1_i1.p1 GENE.c9631_g1_i1~~c9631_g1_i1.p1  ORF type:complete len:122 (+),score=17.61 c9631_g1_i1:66-431(+)